MINHQEYFTHPLNFKHRYLPLTVHWSLEKGLISDVMVGVFGGFTSILQVYAAWCATA